MNGKEKNKTKKVLKNYDDASLAVLSCLAEMTLSRVSSWTLIPLVSRSATMAMDASSSPRSRHRLITSSYNGLR